MSIFAGIWRVMKLDRGRELLGPGFAGCRGGAGVGPGRGAGPGMLLLLLRLSWHRDAGADTDQTTPGPKLSTHPLTLLISLFLLFIPTLFVVSIFFFTGTIALIYFKFVLIFFLFLSVSVSVSYKQNTFSFFASYL